ncbi:MAG TPA: hypothetical protein VE733_13795 [Streptosporangiaceae bacterium]|jgi:hypothetical protein|nr:hypothetical protein [Streptosporangiaceae bacterium]
MHPDLIRAIAEQHVRDMQATAQDGLRARQARHARKARLRRSSAPDLLATVRIPDYVDGTFRADPGPADGTSPGGGPLEEGTAQNAAAGRDAA